MFALGWAAARASGTGQRLPVAVAALATVPGFFGQPQREAVIVAGLWLLIWVPTVPSLGVPNRLAQLLAASSLYIYLTHWQVFPRLRDQPLVALAAALAAGIGYATVANRVGGWLRARRRPGTRLRPPWWRPATLPQLPSETAAVTRRAQDDPRVT